MYFNTCSIIRIFHRLARIMIIVVAKINVSYSTTRTKLWARLWTSHVPPWFLQVRLVVMTTRMLLLCMPIIGRQRIPSTNFTFFPVSNQVPKPVPVGKMLVSNTSICTITFLYRVLTKLQFCLGSQNSAIAIPWRGFATVLLFIFILYMNRYTPKLSRFPWNSPCNPCRICLLV